MANNDFVEPTAFSINESSLEKSLLDIGSHSLSEKKQHVKQKPVKEDIGIVLDAINKVPISNRKKCLLHILNSISRFNANMVRKNTFSSSKMECRLGKNSDEILYKNISIKGKWSGLEVVICGEDNDIIIACPSGDGWDDVSSLFLIKKQ